MFPSDADYYARKEYYGRLQREAELDRSVKTCQSPYSCASISAQNCGLGGYPVDRVGIEFAVL